MKPRSLIILIILAIVANLFLFVTIQRKQHYLDRAKTFLADDSVVYDYLNYRGERLADTYQREASGLPSKAKEIVKTSVEFTDALAALGKMNENLSVIDAEDFFGQKFSISNETQKQLQYSYAQFSNAVKYYLEGDQLQAVYMKIRSERRSQYSEMQRQMRSAPHNTKKIFQYPLSLVDTTLVLKVAAEKRNDQIYPDEHYAVIPHYLEKLDYFVANTRLAKLSEKLQKLDEALAIPGKVKVYANTYDLHTVSPAELDAIVKYLTSLQLDIQAIMLENQFDLF